MALRPFLIATAVLFASPALALDKIDSPIISVHELEFEYSGDRTFDHAHEKNDVQGHELDISYGVNNHWATELGTGFSKEPDHNFRLTEVEWENRFQFFDQGQYWLDPGLLISYIHTVEEEAPDAVEAKLMLQKDVGRWTHLANLVVEQEVGAHASGGPNRGLLWSSRYRLDDHFHPGFEVQSGFGKANEHQGFNEQEHYIGPAAYGSLFGHIGYEAAWLFGVSDAAAKSAVRLKLEYEVNF